jgi:hypothetical protein
MFYCREPNDSQAPYWHLIFCLQVKTDMLNSWWHYLVPVLAADLFKSNVRNTYSARVEGSHRADYGPVGRSLQLKFVLTDDTPAGYGVNALSSLLQTRNRKMTIGGSSVRVVGPRA